MKDSFECPRCKKATIQPVQQWTHDFLAVHKYEMRRLQTQSGGFIDCEVFYGCDTFGPLPRIEREPLSAVSKVRTTKRIEESKDLLF